MTSFVKLPKPDSTDGSTFTYDFGEGTELITFEDFVKEKLRNIEEKIDLMNAKLAGMNHQLTIISARLSRTPKGSLKVR